MAERERLSLVPDEIVIPVDRLTFLVPSRAFHIDGMVLRGGYVSVATEFALRLLRDAGELSPGELGTFLGFSELETRTLVQELIVDGYLEVDGDRVVLAQRGLQAFDHVTGELNLLNVEPFADNITLDLVSFAPIETSGRAWLPWLSEVDIQDRQRAAAAREEAAKGFRANFGEWRDRRFFGEGGSAVRLHTVTDVVPLARSTTPVTIPVTYSPSRGESVDPDFSALRDRGRRDARKELIECINDAIRRIVAPGDHVDGARFSSRWDGGALCGGSSASAANPLNWMQFAARVPPAPLPELLTPSLRLSGSAMSPSFLNSVSQFLGETGTEASDVPVIWVPAEHSAWGASSYLLDVTRQIKSGFAHESGLVLMPRSRRDEKSKGALIRSYGEGKNGRQQPLFDTCIALPPDSIPQSLELIVQPGAWAIVLVHIPGPNGGFPIPVGYATRNPNVVRSISDEIKEVVTELPEEAVVWMTRQEDAAVALDDLLRKMER